MLECHVPEGAKLLCDAATPSRYHLTIEPNLKKFRFSGMVHIDLDIHRPTRTTELHARELTIGAVRLHDRSGIIEAVRIEHRDTVMRIHWPRRTVPGKACLAIDFVGIHNDSMAGFYRSKYRDNDGNERLMVSTQFEALDARRCFPCWDEPAKKARFACTLVVPNRLTALSNESVVSEEPMRNGCKRVTFRETPVMSTYLLCFVVGEFDFIERKTKSNVVVRCYSPPGRKQECDFALDVAIKSLELYEDFFGIPYPMNKLDHVAIPEFAAGAMENWGLVTYRSADLLLHSNSTVAQRQRVFAVVVHETAHQWFGNLVTMNWWDDLWLNEGFACWMESYAASRLQPDWRPWDSFVVEVQARAQALDALRSSHPVQVPIHAAEEVEQVFDAISYCKGACVISMVYGLLGEDRFRDGLRLYMKKYAYKNTVTQNLWDAWEEASDVPIKRLMERWTRTEGFPLLRITRDGHRMTVTQQRFLADGTGGGSDQWIVPMRTRDHQGVQTRASLETKNNTYDVGHNRWCCVNADQATMARVQYPEEDYARLVNAAASLTVRDRIGLVSDAYACCRAGFVSVPALITTLSLARTEADPWVWSTLAQPLAGLYRLLRCSDKTKARAFRNAVLPWIQGFRRTVAARQKQEYEPDDVWNVQHRDALETKLRRTLLSLYQLFVPDQAFVEEANRRFDRRSEQAISPEIRATVFRTVMQNSPEKYPALRILAKTAASDAERKQIYRAMGWVANPLMKQQNLDWVFDHVKLQDMHTPILGVSESDAAGADLAFQWLKNNIGRVMERYARASPALLAALVRACCTGSCSVKALCNVTEFLTSRSDLMKRCGPKIEQMLESMRNNQRFLARLLKHGF